MIRGITIRPDEDIRTPWRDKGISNLEPSIARASSKLIHLSTHCRITRRGNPGAGECAQKMKTHPAKACDRDEPRGGAAYPIAEWQQGHPRRCGRLAAPFVRRRRRLLELLAALPACSPPPPCTVRVLRLLFSSFGLTLPGERRRAALSRRPHACASCRWLAPWKSSPLIWSSRERFRRFFSGFTWPASGAKGRA